MLFLGLGILFLAMKFLAIDPVAAWSWWIVLAPFALASFAVLAVPGMLVSAAATLLLLRRHAAGGANGQPKLEMRNPFDLAPALLLMVLTMGLTLLARWVLLRFGNQGVALVLAISGTVDVDSAIITMGNLPAGTLEPRLAGLVLAVPVVLNTLFKCATLLGLAGRKGRPAVAAMLASLAAMGLAFALT